MPSAVLGNFFRGLFGRVGDSRENDPDDVVRVKTAMRRLGYYNTPSYGMTGYIDRDLDDGIRAYQEENGLRVDGWMKPDGPTYRRLAADLETVAASRTGWPPIPKLKEDREPPTLIPLGEPRGEDRWGEGWFGADRDSGRRQHEGLDFKVAPGSRIPSTVTGRVSAIGSVYGRPRIEGRPEPVYRYVEVTTPDRFATRHFYVEPTVNLGDEVEAGSSMLGVPESPGRVIVRSRTGAGAGLERGLGSARRGKRDWERAKAVTRGEGPKEPGRSGFRQFKPLDPARLLRSYR